MSEGVSSPLRQPFELTEFHDARVRSLAIRRGEVALSFDRFVCYEKTDAADVFDVRSCELELIFSDEPRVDLRECVIGEGVVADGALLQGELEILIRQNTRLQGACRCELTLTTGGKIRIDSRSVEIRFGEGRFLERWVGPLA